MSDTVKTCSVHPNDFDCDCATGTRHRMMVNDPKVMLQFMTAGKATFTLKNRETGERATYRVEGHGDGFERTYKVFAFTGQDNSRKGHYTMMGILDADGTWIVRDDRTLLQDLENRVLIYTPAKSFIHRFLAEFKRMQREGEEIPPHMQKRYNSMLRSNKIPGFISDPVKLNLFPQMWEMLTESKPVPETWEFWHEGCCGRCGRRLTVPASIELGHGHNCAHLLGRKEEWEALNTKLGDDLESYAKGLAARTAQAAATPAV